MQEAALPGGGFGDVLDRIEQIGDRPRARSLRQGFRCNPAGGGAPGYELRLAEDIETTADSSVHGSLSGPDREAIMVNERLTLTG